MFEQLTTVLDWFGLVIFAITGALVASRKQMDILGFVLLATVTGVGGGTLRDVVLDAGPVFWVNQPQYIVVCVIVACLMFFVAHIPQSRLKLVLWLDAGGLALFAVTGAELALSTGAGSVIAITMGVMTATFGGILRDLLGGEEPIIRQPEVYITAALFGACVFVVSDSLGVPRSAAMIVGFVAAFTLRAAALHWHLALPQYRSRPGR